MDLVQSKKPVTHPTGFKKNGGDDPPQAETLDLPA
jgi:hypothetical protein